MTHVAGELERRIEQTRAALASDIEALLESRMELRESMRLLFRDAVRPLEDDPLPGRLPQIAQRRPDRTTSATRPDPAHSRGAEPATTEQRRERRPAPSYQWATPSGALGELPTHAPTSTRRLPRVGSRFVLVALAAASIALGAVFALSLFRNDTPTPTPAIRSTAARPRAAPRHPHAVPAQKQKPSRPPAATPTRPPSVTTQQGRSAGPATTTAESKPKTEPANLPPRSSKPRQATNPKAAAAFVPTRDWGWPAQPDAAGYEVAFRLGGRTVYHTLTMETDVTLPPTFHFRAGTYRWSVRALPVKPGARPIVDSTFVLTKAAAAAANAS